MAQQSLDVVYRYEKKKEDEAANVLQKAQLHYQAQQQKLDGLSQFRLEYMQQLMNRAGNGITSIHFSHYQQFVAKLDKAAEQQASVIAAAKKVVAQRREQWLTQRTRVKSVEHLIAKQVQAAQVLAAKQEQKMFDEIASQRFIRARSEQLEQ